MVLKFHILDLMTHIFMPELSPFVSLCPHSKSQSELHLSIYYSDEIAHWTGWILCQIITVNTVLGLIVVFVAKICWHPASSTEVYIQKMNVFTLKCCTASELYR